MSSEPSPLISHLRAMIADTSPAGHTAILTTISPEGWPHAAWMGTAASPDHRHIFTLTSPDSAKVRHIRQNPRTEWMLVDSERKTVLYLRGDSRVVDDVGEMKHAWQLFPDKSRAFFLSFFNSGPGYSVIETTILEVEWHLPQEGKRGKLPPASLAGV